jgi:hypothetical protein
MRGLALLSDFGELSRAAAVAVSVLPLCDTSCGGVDMIRKLTKHGKSLVFVLDRGVLDLLEIDADSPLNIKTDGRCLIVTPA